MTNRDHLPLGFEVKQLEWVEGQTKDGRKQWQADGEAITETHPEWDTVQGYRLFNAMATYPTLEAAKAAAQADFERRVRECVVAKPVDVASVRRQAFDEGIKECAEIADAHNAFSTYDAILALSAEPAQGEP